ncbi:neural cell adhesion molecule 1-like [Mya arenaria]|uniref:neural cell adhesion molecule 1-like n=1 Tax=Mya arenaria TaxID=6604 RepID=UPI0022E1BB69|nr:neural cell adhesion molecule 1-like [Mya arenaria]
MKEIYSLFIIPVVLFHSVIGAELLFDPGESMREVKTRDLFFVNCLLNSSIPSPSNLEIKWFDKTGAEITSSSPSDHVYAIARGGGKELNIDTVEDDDGGNYQCKAVVDGVVAYERTLSIRVEASLTFSNCDEEQFGVVGRRSRINCQASGPTAPGSEWRFRDQVLGLNTGLYAFETTYLVILNTTKESEGIYKYYAWAKNVKKSRAITFKVLVAPVIINPVLSTTATVGNTTQLFCMASGDPLPTFSWYKVDENDNAELLQTTDRIKITDKAEGVNKQGILTITEIVKEDEAIYRCVAKNLANDYESIDGAQAENKLEVYTPPTVKEFSNLIENRYQGTEGGSVTLTCEARGDPAPNVIWRKVGTNQQFTVGSSSETISVTEDTINDPTNPGIVLKLGMKNLAALDGGMYECEAKNKAGVATRSVKLEVLFSPNFDGQETEYDRTFYTWAGNPNGDVVCVSNANPEPVFRWYHNGQEIKQGTTGYGLSQKASDDENYPYRHYSTLSVAFNGGNDDVFGSYVCQAANRINSNNQTLSLVKATVPPKPNVITKEQLPTQMTFWLMEPSVDGPEVTHFTVTYKISGSPEEAQVITIEKEFRDHIDADRKYTIIIVNDLLPSSEYTFTFFAKNAVGPGAGEEKRLGTPAIKEPAMVNIMSPSNSQYPTRIRVTWDEPNNGGSEILSYKVSYQQVEVRLSNQTLPTPGYQLQRPITNPITKDAIKDKFYDIQDLVPGSFYQVKVSATNNKGEGVAGTKIILTKQAEVYGASTAQGGLSTGAIIGIVVGVFFLLFILVDVTCYLKNRCGILMTIREKVSGTRGEDGYSAAKTDDVENLAKKDELTEEAKAVEEAETADPGDVDEKKEPLLSEEQKVDTVDEGETQPEKVELEPEDKDDVKPATPPAESPVQETTPTQPSEPQAPAEEPPASTDAPAVLPTSTTPTSGET